MKDTPFYLNSFHHKHKDNTSIWEWKGSKRKHTDNKLSVTQLFQESKQKLEEAVEGPGAGLGIGCGVGVGWGVVGGVDVVGGGCWNQLKMVFGIGMGCGVGVGIGYGQGIGVGSSLDSLKNKFFSPKGNAPRKPIVIKI